MDSRHRQIKLYDVDGRFVVRLSDVIEEFDHLVELLQGCIAAKGDSTAERIRMSKARRAAVWMAVGGVVALVATAGSTWMVHEQGRADQLMENAAVPGVAGIEELKLAPNGFTPRLVYRVTAPSGQTATRNAEIERGLWDDLHGKRTVPVLYVPDEPSISRLVTGEVVDNDRFKRPPYGYALSALGLGFAVFFFGAALLTWRGWDIGFDDTTKRFYMRRYGAGRTKTASKQ